MSRVWFWKMWLKNRVRTFKRNLHWPFVRRASYIQALDAIVKSAGQIAGLEMQLADKDRVNAVEVEQLRVLIKRHAEVSLTIRDDDRRYTLCLQLDPALFAMAVPGDVAMMRSLARHVGYMVEQEIVTLRIVCKP